MADASPEINGTAAGAGYDQVNVTGTFTLSSNTPITLTLGYNPADHVDSFVIISNDGTEPIVRNGFFTYNTQVLSEGSISTAGGQGFQIPYAGGETGTTWCSRRFRSLRPPCLCWAVLECCSATGGRVGVSGSQFVYIG